MIEDAIAEEEGTPAEYDRIARHDIELFREAAAQYTRGELTADQFRPHRLRRGVYGQRQPDVHMIRTKVPSGLVTVTQMRQLAAIADEFGAGKGHLTTRQNVHYHFAPLPPAPAPLPPLPDVLPAHP